MRTLSQKAEQISSDLAGDPKLFSQVLDGLIEKTAKNKIPEQVVKMASEIQHDTGVKEEDALKMAWDAYTKYINPSAGPKAVKTAAAKTGAMKTASARSLAAQLAGVFGKEKK
jgi:hypothetical protein